MPINNQTTDPRSRPGLGATADRPPQVGPMLPPAQPGQPGQIRAERLIDQPRRYHAEAMQGVTLSTDIGFPARSILASNFSNQYVYLAEADRYLLPGEVGAVLFANHQNTLTAFWRTPDGVSQPVNPAGSLYLVATEEWIAPVPGADGASILLLEELRMIRVGITLLLANQNVPADLNTLPNLADLSGLPIFRP